MSANNSGFIMSLYQQQKLPDFVYCPILHLLQQTPKNVKPTAVLTHEPRLRMRTSRSAGSMGCVGVSFDYGDVQAA